MKTDSQGDPLTLASIGELPLPLLQLPGAQRGSFYSVSLAVLSLIFPISHLQPPSGHCLQLQKPERLRIDECNG